MSALLLAAISSSAAAQITLKVSTWVPRTHALSKTQAKWCESVAVVSNGRIRCNILDKAPVPPPQTLEAVASGELDVSFTVHGYTPGRFVMTQMAELPVLGNHAEAISVAYQRMNNRYPQFAAEHQGVKILSLFTHGPGGVYTSKKPFVTLADVQGVPMRIGGGMASELAKTMGIQGVLKPSSEIAELLKTGAVEGVLFPAESIEAFKIDKIVRYGTTFSGGLYNTSFVFMMNQDRYNKLSPEDRKVIDQVSGEAIARSFGRAWDDADRKGMAYMQVAQVALRPADAKLTAELKAKLAPLEQRWIEQAKASGLSDPAKMLAEFRAEITKLDK